ncbi:MAG: hypothetical protein A2Z24_00035 [Candidatus Woykebacteria bacterium RBG_16_44_10]|uniref:Uncharacterized protein n=1 Tax=Candidatus Woykebacteria bacterium RBG_16_44_10 TaxID=1802597 RepID=A0A1G1WD26_9BACT|nr:MAG: hypothetical protein A2Z24_00035 [Candidatus Woykebacteria bacterium RBG_16_44_10]
MRLTILKSFPWKIVYIVAAALLLWSLVIFSSSGNTKQAKNTSGPNSSKFQEENQESQVNPTQPEVVNESENGVSSQESTSTKVHVSVNSNTTNGETTGQASVQITRDGQTQTFSDALDQCIADGDIRVRVDGTKIKCESDNGNLEINWRSDNNQDTKSESTFKQDVDIDKDSH